MKTMKKIVAILAVALMLCSILPLSVFAADNVADLNTLATNTSYTTRTTTNGWVATNAATHKAAMTSQNVAVILNGKKTAKGTLTSPTLSDGISELSFGYGYSYSESKGVNATINIKDTAGNVVATNNLVVSSITQNTAYTYSWTLPTAVTGDFVIEILNNGPSNNTSNKDRLSIWNVTWVSAAAEGDCEHEWELISTTAATCTAAGEEYYECSGCGESKTEAVAALGHKYGEATETVAPDCVNAGEQESTCSVCGDVKTEAINALGHNYVDGFCDVCGEVEPLEVTIVTFANTGVLDGTASISWTNGDFQFTTYKASSSSAIRTSDADHFRIYAHNKVVVSALNGKSMTQIQFNATSSSYAEVLGGCTAEGWVASVDGTVVTFTATAGSAESLTIADVSAQTRIASIVIIPYVEIPSDCEHDYVGVETQAPTCSAEGVMTYTCSKCQESYTEAIAVIAHNYVEDIIDSTCTTTGTKTYECSVCFHSYDETIPVKDHNYVDDVCADCGAVKAYKGTLVFDADKANRTEYSTEIQVWEQNGVKLTNNKASSTTNIGDYAGRFYKNSQIIIEFPEMSKLIIDATGVDNDKLWDATLEAAGLSFTVENKIYTITFAEAVNSIELTAANQVRANSITAIVAHECVYDNACDADCNKCGTIRGVGEHTYAHDFDVDCDVCGAVRAVAGPVSYIAKSISEDCNGLAMLFQADVEGIAVKFGTFVQADYTNATYNGYKLIKLGVIASNGVSETNIEGLRMYELEDGCAKFAFRVVNIPADKLDVEITMTPYYIVEIDGVATTIYGEAQTGSYAQVAG